MADQGDDLARLSHEHAERLKELGALHDTARLLRDTRLSVGDLLARVVARIPAAMQFVDDTTARITWGEHTAASPTWTVSPWVLRRTFVTADARTGVLEVAYGSPHPEAQEGPFLSEERALIDSIADMICGELDRRTADSASREHATKFMLAMSTADLAVWEWDIDANIVTWSPELVRMLGGDNTGGTLGSSSLIHPDDRDRVIGAVRAAPHEFPDRVFDLEFRFMRADGSVGWIGARGRVLPAGNGRPRRVMGVLADVTRRKQLEDGVAQLQKMEAMGRVAAGVAHDFNNLLSVMTLNTGELLEQLPRESQMHQLASEINDMIGRGIGLTQQLLAFSRKSEIKPVRLDPNVVIRRAEPMLKRIAGKRVALEMALGADASVVADATQLDQVVLNLVVNARDAIEDGGTIKIETRDVNVDSELAAEVGSTRVGPHVMISVSDTGLGMTPETKARLFEPFFTTKPVGKGTGLGLAVVFGIVQQSHGFVTVDSEQGRGSQFHVHLPAA